MKKTIFTTVLLFCLSMMLSLSSYSQTSRRKIITDGVESVPTIANTVSGGHYITFQNNYYADFRMLSKEYDASDVGVEASMLYSNADNSPDYRFVSFIEDGSNLVYLFNDVSDGSFDIIKVNSASGSIVAKAKFDIGVTSARSLKIIQGSNGSYYVAVNASSTAYLVNINSTTLALNSNIRFTSTFIVYDFAQLNANEWLLVGYGSGINPTMLKFSYSTLTVTSAVYSLGSAGNIDKVVVDQVSGTIYIVIPYTVAGKDEVIVCKVNSSLGLTGHTRLIHTGSIRAASVFYDGSDLIITGKNEEGNEYGFITSLDGSSLSQNWTKVMSGIAIPNPGTKYMSAVLTGSEIFYAVEIDGEINWGSANNSSTVGSCFESVSFTETTKSFTYPSYGISTAPHTTTVTSGDAYVAGSISTDLVVDGIECDVCNLSSTDYNKVYSSTISSDATWGVNGKGSKYYVEGNVTVASGVTLDITGVDVVFAPSATLTVAAGGILKANNSVFRPCTTYGTWEGIMFWGDGGEESMINGCTFIQATSAISYEPDNFEFETRIHNNQFTDCQSGISLVGINTFNGSVSGNRFDITRTYDDCFLSTSAVGIYLDEVLDNPNISKNEFVQTADPSGGSTNFDGVYMTASYATITENNFVECRTAVESRSSFAIIAGNKIEVMKQMNSPAACIIVANNEQYSVTQVVNNTLIHPTLFNPTVGILVENSQDVEVDGNLIDGYFVNGIVLRECTDTRVYSNQIIDPAECAIYAENTVNTTIKCNEMDLGYHAIGVYYRQTVDEDNNLDIRGNCISNSSYAIFLSASDEWTLPNIENNFFYNYELYGIYNDLFTGSIGTGASAPQDGRNTFVSNNSLGFSTDIYSVSGAIAVDGNYNIQLVNGNVTVNSNNNSHSTASCGHFFTNSINTVRLEEEDECDAIYANGDGTIIINYAEQPMIIIDNAKNTNTINDPYRRLTNWAAAAKAVKAYPTELDKLTNFIKGNEENKDVIAIYDAYVAILAGNTVSAGSMLAEIKSSDARLNNAAKNMKILVELVENEGIINESITEMLVASKESNDFFANEARAYQSPVNPNFEYPVVPAPAYQSVTNPTDIRNISMTSFEVYPNPANGDVISVEISTPGITSSTILVRDITGRVVATQLVNMSSGAFTIPVNDFSNGVYFVSIETEEEVIATKKLVVTH